MENFAFNLPTEIIFGKKQINNLHEYVKKYGVKKILLHHDGGDYLEKSGLLPQVRSSLSNDNIEFIEIGKVVPNPRLSYSLDTIDQAREEGVDFVLAIGGGSVIDSSKVVAAGLYEDLDFDKVFKGKNQIQGSIPLGVILTIASSGSESSDAAIINVDSKTKRAVNSPYFVPKFAILDPELTFSLPEYQTASGGCDIMMHTFERYFTPTDNVQLTDRLSEGLVNAVMDALRIACKEPDNYEARATLMWAGSLSHNGLMGTGKTEDWGVHMIGHELSGHYDVTHGASLCAIWGSWARYVAQENKKRFLQFSEKMMNQSIDLFNEDLSIEKGIVAMESFFKSVKMPTSLKELGLDLSEKDIEELAESALIDKDHIGEMYQLKKDDVISILNMAK